MYWFADRENITEEDVSNTGANTPINTITNTPTNTPWQ